MTVGKYMQGKENHDTEKEFRVMGKGKRKYGRIEHTPKSGKFKIITSDDYTERYITKDTNIFFL